MIEGLAVLAIGLAIFGLIWNNRRPGSGSDTERLRLDRHDDTLDRPDTDATDSDRGGGFGGGSGQGGGGGGGGF